MWKRVGLATEEVITVGNNTNTKSNHVFYWVKNHTISQFTPILTLLKDPSV